MSSAQWSEVTDHIWIGSYPKDKDTLRVLKNSTECTAILSLQSDADHDFYKLDWFELQEDAEKLDFVMSRIPMNDFDLEHQRKVLGEAVHGLASLLSKNHTVYLYCSDGINRSPLVVLAYLTFCLGQSLEEANLLLLTKHPLSAPPIEVWRASRLELLKNKDSQVESLTHKTHSPLSVDNAEKQILQSLFLPQARENYGL